MEKLVVEIPVERLKIGLYVSRLDRPWSETPFLFQGFEVESDEDLAQLKSLCRVVHVEVTAEEAEELRSAAAAKPPAPAAARTDKLGSLAALLANLQPAESAKDPVPWHIEITNARKVFGDARAVVAEIFNRFRRGGVVDVALLDNVMDSMVDSVIRNRDALTWLACMKRKDDYLYNHSLSTSVVALAFGRHLGLDKESLKLVGIGAMLLDVGKTQLPDALLKSPDKPSPGEWETLRAHVDHGLELLQSDLKIDARVRQMIATHHERIDGTGYPNQLQGDSIPLVGRIAGIVDAYDAMTSDRPYAIGKSTYDAVIELKKLGGTWFQFELIELFIQAVGVFPTGTMVELNTGEVGVVIAQNRFRRLRPEIMLVLDASKQIRDEFVTVDLQMREQVSAINEPPLWITRGLEPGAYDFDPTEFFL